MAREVLAIEMTGAQVVGVVNNNDSELYSKGGGNAINVKDYGAVGDGLTDDTIAIQYAQSLVDWGGTLLFPSSSGSYMIKATGDNASGDGGGIWISTPMLIQFEKDATLQAIPGAKADSQLLKINSTLKVEISGGRFIGDWHSRVDIYEGNCGINIENSSNIYIHDCSFEQFAGDGISCYRSGAGVSKNNRFERSDFTDVRRFGIFADCDENTLIRSCTFHDILSDLAYGGGIDIEDSSGLAGVHIKNVLVDACSFENIGDNYHSDDGAFTTNGNFGTVEGIKFINNFVENCNAGSIFTQCTSLSVYNNTFVNNGVSINIFGLSTPFISGIIANNTFETKGSITFGFGSVPSLYIQFVSGVIVSGNIFKDFTTNKCIWQAWCQTSQLSFVNNIFKNCSQRFVLDPRFGGQHYFSGNISIDDTGLAINDDNTVGKITDLTHSRGTTTGTPTAGTYESGEWLNETGFIAAGYIGRICTVAGTMEVINTTCVADGSAVVIVSDPYNNNISIGQYVKVNGGAALKIIAIGASNNITLSGNVGAGSGLSFVNSPAVFKKFGALEP